MILCCFCRVELSKCGRTIRVSSRDPSVVERSGGGQAPPLRYTGFAGCTAKSVRFLSYGPPVLPGTPGTPGAPGTGVVAGAPDGRTDVGGRLLGSSSMV